jgi:hypothetical protein
VLKKKPFGPDTDTEIGPWFRIPTKPGFGHTLAVQVQISLSLCCLALLHGSAVKDGIPYVKGHKRASQKGVIILRKKHENSS